LHDFVGFFNTLVIMVGNYDFLAKIIDHKHGCL